MLTYNGKTLDFSDEDLTDDLALWPDVNIEDTLDLSNVINEGEDNE